MNPLRTFRFSLALLAALCAAGCASLLPTSTSVIAHFSTFDEARHSIESLVPQVSTRQTLAELGINPEKQPNTVILSQTDVARRVTNGNLQISDYLDKGIVACLAAGAACRGWEFTASRITRDRTGNFALDFANFKRTTETVGWRFNALILLVNDVVVYRAWGGQPNVREVEVRNNPLGPLQDSGPGLVNGAR